MSELAYIRVRWSKEKRAIFLDHLAATCNVTASAEAAGINPRSAYSLRRKDPEFAEEWRDAVIQAYELIETALAAHALAGGGIDRRVETPAGDMHVEDALRILAVHRNTMAGKWRGGPKRRIATSEETDRAILEKLAAMEKVWAREDAQG